MLNSAIHFVDFSLLAKEAVADPLPKLLLCCWWSSPVQLLTGRRRLYMGTFNNSNKLWYVCCEQHAYMGQVNSSIRTWLELIWVVHNNNNDVRECDE